MRAQTLFHVLVSLVCLAPGANGCALLLDLDEFTDEPPGAEGTSGMGGAGGEEPGCTPDASESCYGGPPVTRNEGACREGKRTCAADGTWGVCAGEILPAVERCEAAEDEDCDGLECVVWATAYQQTSSAQPLAIASDPDGSVVVSVAFSGTITVGDETFASADATDVLLLKLSPAGEALWAKKFGDLSADNAWGLAVDSRGHPVLAGESTYGTDFGGGPRQAGPFVAQFDPSGRHIWSKSLGGAGTLKAIAIDQDDDVIVVGTFEGQIDFGGVSLESAGEQDIVVAKLDGATGLATKPGCWARSFGGTGAEGSKAVAVDQSKNIFLTGWSDGTVSFGTPGLPIDVEKGSFVVKLTPAGNTGWATRMSGTGLLDARSITVSSTGRPAVAGYFSEDMQAGTHDLTAKDGMDVFVVQLDSDGEVGWARTFGGDDDQRALGLARDPSGNLVVVGDVSGQIDFGDGLIRTMGEQAFVAKLTPDAELEWNRFLGAEAILSAVATSPAGETFVAGATRAVDADFGTGPLPGIGDGIFYRLVVAKLGR
ncbi:SBBP repeat-containing protein [Sorangium sp. So ce131]|uniref:SBBP repeat-containing protein n=1 Tax=Sorangium sp. So ce131 TaxID=3133282 RepID=UPI003F5DE306